MTSSGRISKASKRPSREPPATHRAHRVAPALPRSGDIRGSPSLIRTENRGSSLAALGPLVDTTLRLEDRPTIRAQTSRATMTVVLGRAKRPKLAPGNRGSALADEQPAVAFANSSPLINYRPRAGVLFCSQPPHTCGRD